MFNFSHPAVDPHCSSAWYPVLVAIGLQAYTHVELVVLFPVPFQRETERPLGVRVACVCHPRLGHVDESSEPNSAGLENNAHRETLNSGEL